jgi:hypothetical protein
VSGVRVLGWAAGGYRPVLDPLPVHGWEWALLPVIALLLSMAYKGVRTERPERYWRETWSMALAVTLGFAAVSAGAWVLIEVMALLDPT